MKPTEAHPLASGGATASDASLPRSLALPSRRRHQISFGSILAPIGVSFMVYGFGAFFGLLPGGDVSSLLLIYGAAVAAAARRARCPLGCTLAACPGCWPSFANVSLVVPYPLPPAGFPITLLGFALSYAQLKPVPCK